MVKTYETARDVFDHARLFHAELGERYHALSGKADQARVKMLLDYLSRHEEHLQESLKGYETDLSKQVMDTWFQYVPEEEKLQQCENIALEPEMSVADVVTVALHMDNCLLDLYKEIAEVAVTDDVKEVFTNLLEMEEQEKHKLVRNALLLQDI